MWVMFREEKDSDNFNEVYWNGEFTGRGTPSTTVYTEKARHFKTPREAYDTAGATKKMDWWKAGWR